MIIMKRVLLTLTLPFILLLFALGAIYEGCEDETR